MPVRYRAAARAAAFLVLVALVASMAWYVGDVVQRRADTLVVEARDARERAQSYADSLSDARRTLQAEARENANLRTQASAAALSARKAASIAAEAARVSATLAEASRRESEAYVASGRDPALCDQTLSSCERARESLLAAVRQAETARRDAENALAASDSLISGLTRETVLSARALRYSEERATLLEFSTTRYEQAYETERLARTRGPLVALNFALEHRPAETFMDGWTATARGSIGIWGIRPFGGVQVNPSTGEWGPVFGVGVDAFGR